MEQKFFVSCLIVRDNKILMLHKEKGRHIGAWVYPGGGIKDDENPLDTVKREILKDTGLTLKHVELRGITSFMMQENPNEPVLSKTTLYVFYSNDIEGEMISSVKGKLAWIPLEQIWNRKLGRNDSYFIPPMLEKKKVTFASFYHNKEKELIRYHID